MTEAEERAHACAVLMSQMRDISRHAHNAFVHARLELFRVDAKAEELAKKLGDKWHGEQQTPRLECVAGIDEIHNCSGCHGVWTVATPGSYIVSYVQDDGSSHTDYYCEKCKVEVVKRRKAE